MADRRRAYAARGLLRGLLELARDADPDRASVALVAVPAGELVAAAGAGTDPATLDPETPVFAEFYFPDTGAAITRVFGMDLSTPAGQTGGRFLSHPDGDPDVSLTDDLHAVLFVAVPPWDPGNVRAYSRSGRELDVVTVAGETPERVLE
ncbi:MAG: hypothetical protein ABEH77_04735 [Halobacteriaceae archaeon]